MILKAGTAPHSQWQALVPLLKNFGWRDTQGNSLETWYQNAEALSEGINIFLYTRPDVAVALAMDDGLAPGDALQAWRVAIKHMLVFYKRNPATSVILDVSRVLRNPETSIVVLKQHMGLTPSSQSITLQQPKSASRVSFERATRFVNQDKELHTLLLELEACTLPIDDPAFHSPRLYVLELYRELQTDSPEHAERRLAQCERLLKALTRLEDELENERQNHTQTKRALDDAREDTELVLHQLLRAHEELEHSYLGRRSSNYEMGTSRSTSPPANNIHRTSLRRLVSPLRALIRTLNLVNKAGIKKRMALLNQSEFFDAKWYLQMYPDVAGGRLNPVEHYLRYGAKEQRDPSPRFSTSEYLRANPDVAESGMNPLVHYLSFGKNEGRKAVP